MADVTDAHLYQIASPKLAVDPKVKKREIPGPVLHL
jgi:hypothetical protein